MSHTFAGRSASKTGGTLEKGRLAVTKVRRYWKGRAPEWLTEEEETPEVEKKRETAAPVIVVKNLDPRLQRLSLSEKSDDKEVPAHRRLNAEASRVSESPKEEISEIKEEEEDLLEKRAQLRLRLVENRRDEPELMSEEEEESESEYSSESEEDVKRQPLPRPVFVSADSRATIQEREKKEEEEELELREQEENLEERKQYTKQIVAQKIKEEEEALKAKDEMPVEAADIVTDEDEEDDAELESWKEREMERIKRDKEQILVAEKYAEEREKLKNMTEEEREIYDKLNPKVEKTKVKKKWNFLQKYWHKGAYYQEDPDDARGTAGTDMSIFGRDYSDPTGEDKIDKSSLPKVMQVKNFGKAGRTKWTHLVNEDTTNFKDDPWTKSDALRNKYNKRMAATDQDFQKPKKFKS